MSLRTICLSVLSLAESREACVGAWTRATLSSLSWTVASEAGLQVTIVQKLIFGPKVTFFSFLLPPPYC